MTTITSEVLDAIDRALAPELLQGDNRLYRHNGEVIGHGMMQLPFKADTVRALVSLARKSLASPVEPEEPSMAEAHEALTTMLTSRAQEGEELDAALQAIWRNLYRAKGMRPDGEGAGVLRIIADAILSLRSPPLSPAAPPDVTEAQVKQRAEAAEAVITETPYGTTTTFRYLDQLMKFAALATKPAEPEGVETVRAAWREHLRNLDDLRAYAGKRGDNVLVDLISKDMRPLDQKLRLAPSASPVSAPEWVTVPREPTPEMISAGDLSDDLAQIVYRDMLKAAPAAPSPVGEAKPVAWPPLVKLGQVLGFFASVIKSGEAWSSTCQAEYDAANEAVQSVWRELNASPLSLRAEAIEPEYTTGHCENHKKPGGCPLHNLHCGWPDCDRRSLASDGNGRTV